MAKGKGAKNKKKELSGGRAQYTMRVVTSDRCIVCPTPCARGLKYVSRMNEPGAVGNGVPCILTRTKLSN
ncbi:hypothetical protein [Paenibacillus taiwanensis]|uniref:hypothetical protein n=1 Tax=Paenibacillus taiwanensis TaxID=401638 RepID=UPI0003FED44F|nr:hypothetical protein [Paenibacillus taiwanensis]